jgi:hypothetical protein
LLPSLIQRLTSPAATTVPETERAVFAGTESL